MERWSSHRTPLRGRATRPIVRPAVVLISGWTGAGKSTMADRLGDDLGATVVGFDWVMSALRADPDLWEHVEHPVEHQRRVGWNLLARVVEQQLRRSASCVVDLVAREPFRIELAALAHRYDAGFAVVECVCSDVDLHRRRVEGRQRDIPGWYELTWERVALGRERYQPLAHPKVVLDAVAPLEENHRRALDWLSRSGDVSPHADP